MKATISILALCIAILSPSLSRAQDVESVTLVIDSLTTLPIATGITAENVSDQFIVIAHGERLLPFGPIPFDAGWEPAGQIRLVRGGQLQFDRPYGCLMGMFNNSLNYFFYVGNGGVMIAQPDDVGWEFQLQLNMSASDHAMSSGRFVVTVIRVPVAVPVTRADVVISSATPLPLDTGIIANTGDRFFLRSRGAVRTAPGTFDDGWFDPSGRARLERFGQLVPNVPYGSVLGEFSGAGTFNIGDGGVWDAQVVDIGQPLLLHLNMSAADHTAMQGRFVVTVERIPAAGTDVPLGTRERALEVGKSVPTPTSGPTTIAYRAREAGRVRARIYDESGRWVRTLADAPVSSGDHRLEWDGRDDSGTLVASGIYFCQVSLDDHTETRRLTVVR